MKFVGETLTLSLGDVTYWLGEDGGGCASLVVLAADGFFVPSTNCSDLGGEWQWDEDCAYRAPRTSETPAETLPPCEVTIPLVSFGRLVHGSPELACFVAASEETLGPASFEPISERGLYLVQAPTSRYRVVAFGADGRRYSDYTYADDPLAFLMCDEAGPWNQAPGDPRVLQWSFVALDLDPSWFPHGGEISLAIQVGAGFTGRQNSIEQYRETADSYGIAGWLREGFTVRVAMYYGDGLATQHDLEVPDPPDDLRRNEDGSPVLVVSIGPGLGSPPHVDLSTITVEWQTGTP